MKKVIAILLSFVIMFASVSVSFATNDVAPYSLKYLDSIVGARYLWYQPGDNEAYTYYTLEAYDVFTLWLRKDSVWEDTVYPFREAFKNAGFDEFAEKDNANYNCSIYRKNT